MILVREKLSSAFFSDLYTFRRLRILPGALNSYDCIFQVLDTEAWMDGDLTGTLHLLPFNDIKRFMPQPEQASITAIYGPPGMRKSTILGDLIGTTILKKKRFAFLSLSDNSNWPTYAFMPQMPIKGNKAYKFVTDKMKVKPQGIPVLILNVIRDFSELEERGEVLTKYDRFLKVNDSRSFAFDFEKVLDELARIAEEFGYPGPTGLIAIRNLERSATSSQTTKRFNIEIQNATNALDSFKSWRRNHTKIPCRVSFDEVKEVQMGQAKSREQSQLGDLIEAGSNTARRHHYAMDFVGHLPGDISPRVRGFSNHVFWRNLPEERSEAKSPLATLLESLPIDPKDDPESLRESIRLLSNSESFAESGLFWWADRRRKRIEPVYPMVAPFQNQVVGKDPIEVYEHFLHMNPSIDRDKFYRKGADLKFDWVAYSADSQTKEPQDEDEDVGEAPESDENETW